MGFLNILKPEKEPMQNLSEEMTYDQEVPSVEERLQSFKEKNQISQEASMGGSSEDSDIFTNSSTTIKICKPKAYENVKVIVEAIKNKKAVILDLEKLDNGLAKRILEFVYGACFMEDIAIEKINEQKIFLIDPTHKISRQRG